MRDTLRLDNLERVDRGDFEYVAQETARQHATELPANFITNPAGPRTWIVSGFAATNPSAAQLQVTRGTAFLAYRHKSTVEFGAFTTVGEAQRILDLASYSAGTYGVYIRFEFVDSDVQNRTFWNPTTKAEFSKSIATKRTANWAMRVESVSPGQEWTQVAQVTMDAFNTITGITDTRSLYFEGTTASSYARSWGSGSDRNATRAADGIKDMRTAFDALYKKVEELQTGTNPGITGGRWWTAPVNSLDDVLPLTGATGSYAMRGDIIPDGDDDHDLGSGGVRWSNLYSVNIGTLGILPYAGASYVGAAGLTFAESHVDLMTATDVVPVTTGSGQVGTTGLRWGDIRGYRGHFGYGLENLGELVIGSAINARLPRVQGDYYGVSGQHTCIRAFEDVANSQLTRDYVGGDGEWIHSVNANHSSTGDTWVRDESGAEASRSVLSKNSLSLQYQDATGTTAITWVETFKVNSATKTAFVRAVDMDNGGSPATAVTGPNQLVAAAIPKAYGRATLTSATTHTDNKAFNCTMVSTTGDLVVTFDEDMADADYLVMLGGAVWGGAPEQYAVVLPYLTTGFTIRKYDDTGAALAFVSSDHVRFTVFGDQ